MDSPSSRQLDRSIRTMIALVICLSCAACARLLMNAGWNVRTAVEAAATFGELFLGSLIAYLAKRLLDERAAGPGQDAEDRHPYGWIGPYRTAAARPEPATDLPPGHVLLEVAFAPRFASIKVEQAEKPDGMVVAPSVKALQRVEHASALQSNALRRDRATRRRHLVVKAFPAGTTLGETDAWAAENGLESGCLEELLAVGAADAVPHCGNDVTRVFALGSHDIVDGSTVTVHPVLRLAGKDGRWTMDILPIVQLNANGDKVYPIELRGDTALLFAKKA